MIPEEPPTLAQLGITKRESATFQALARAPETVILEAVAAAGAEGRAASRKDYLAAAKAMRSGGVGSVEAAKVEWLFPAMDSCRLAERFTKWVVEGYALVQGAGSAIVERPGDLVHRIDPAHMEVLANWLFKVTNAVRAHRASRKRTPRPASAVVVDLPVDGPTDEPA